MKCLPYFLPMKLELLNFYFEKNGFKRNSNKKYFHYFRNGYEVKILKNENKAFILKNDLIVFETGLPSKEPSVVKWVNILIEKHETQND